MGKTICERHGATGISLVCRHVAEDVVASQGVRPYAVYPTHIDGTNAVDHAFCRACVVELALPTPPGPLSFGDPELPVAAVCARCLSDAALTS